MLNKALEWILQRVYDKFKKSNNNILIRSGEEKVLILLNNVEYFVYLNTDSLYFYPKEFDIYFKFVSGETKNFVVDVNQFLYIIDKLKEVFDFSDWEEDRNSRDFRKQYKRDSTPAVWWNE